MHFRSTFQTLSPNRGFVRRSETHNIRVNRLPTDEASNGKELFLSSSNVWTLGFVLAISLKLVDPAVLDEAVIVLMKFRSVLIGFWPQNPNVSRLVIHMRPRPIFPDNDCEAVGHLSAIRTPIALLSFQLI